MEINENDGKEIPAKRNTKRKAQYKQKGDNILEIIEKDDKVLEKSNMKRTTLEIEVSTDEHEEFKQIIEMSQQGTEKIDDKNVDLDFDKNQNKTKIERARTEKIEVEPKDANLEEIEQILDLDNKDKISKERSTQLSIQETTGNVFPLSQKMPIRTIRLNTLVRIFQIILCLFIAMPLDTADLVTT